MHLSITPMKPSKFVLFAIAALFYAADLQGALFDFFRSPTGVYIQEETGFYNKEIEEIDVRSDNTYVWKTTTQYKFPDIPEHSVDSNVRGRWRSSGATVSFYLGDDTKGEVWKEFTLDDGDLIEKTGQKRRFAKKRS